MNITVDTSNLRGRLAPLYHRYRGQLHPQPAYVYMAQNGKVFAEYDSVVGGAVSSSVFSGSTRLWRVSPNIDGNLLADLLESMRDLFAKVGAGDDVASGEIDARLQDLCTPSVAWDVTEWLDASAFEEVWPVGWTLATAIIAIDESAVAEHVLLEGDVDAYLLGRAETEHDNRSEVLAALANVGRRAKRAAKGR
jgi:hypothetical protein